MEGLFIMDSRYSCNPACNLVQQPKKRCFSQTGALQTPKRQRLHPKLAISTFLKARNRITEPLDHFHLFPRLPLELREKVWKDAMPPQVLTWRQYQPVPAVLHACYESRTLWLKTHTISHWKTNVFDRHTAFISRSSDIMYFPDVIPGFKDWTEIPKSIDIATGRVTLGRWLHDVKRLAIPYEAAIREFEFDGGLLRVPPPPPPPAWVKDALPVGPWKKLLSWCPKLEELVVVMGGERKGQMSRIESEGQWEEVSSVKLPVEPWGWRWELPNFRVKGWKAERLSRLRVLEVRFVRLERDWQGQSM
ncbi:hypothetical protein F5882DRAFT_439069 [Hyaloscypha sp. PMI_1271]|nr:hypothetical protein F5882DRAFT_439069 [Hyaloscypha sp. PMI_1271]